MPSCPGCKRPGGFSKGKFPSLGNVYPEQIVTSCCMRNPSKTEFLQSIFGWLARCGLSHWVWAEFVLSHGKLSWHVSPGGTAGVCLLSRL